MRPLLGLTLFRYANGGEYDKAIRVFEAALELDPTHENARSYLERCKEKVRYDSCTPCHGR